jgi:hypothetical protein
MSQREHWKQQADDHDFLAASDYLSLVLEASDLPGVVEALRKATPVVRKAKDLLRSSRLPELPPDNVHVAGDLKKIADGKQLSPVLAVRGQLRNDIPLTVADGYHRICASYHHDEDADIPCLIVDPPQR